MGTEVVRQKESNCSRDEIHEKNSRSDPKGQNQIRNYNVELGGHPYHEEDKSIPKKVKRSRRQDGRNQITETGPEIYTTRVEKQRETEEKAH